MKLGRFEIKLAEKQKRPETDEVGSAGTTFFSGSLADNEYNRDLKGSKGITTYEKMRRSDARVKFALLVCELPLRAVTWSVEPASDDTQDQEIAEALEQNLMNMSITWDSFLHHVLLMLPFGFSMFEKVWKIEENQVRYQKIAPRLPSTLYKWDMDENGGLKGITQATWKSDKYQFIDIPAEKLLIFTNEKEGSNFEGVSILRTAYKHWYYKDNLYRIDAIAAERHALGVPHFTHPADASKEDKDRLDALGQRMYANEQAYIRTADGYTFEVKGLTGTIKDIMPSIQHHDRKIAESVLADFIDLGSGDTGSWALSKDKSSFFLMSLAAVGTNIKDTINTYCIPQWVNYNYAGVKEYPKLTHGSLETRDMKLYADAVNELLLSGGLVPAIETENALRDMLKLPQREKEKQTQQSEKRIFQGAEAKKYYRELTLAEQSVQFDEIEKKLNASEEQLIKAASAVRQKQVNKLVDIAMKIIEKRQLERLDDIDVPFRAEMATTIEKVLHDLYKYGRQQVKIELAIQAKLNEFKAPVKSPLPLPSDDSELINEYLHTRAKANANILGTHLKSTVTFESMRQIRQGVVEREVLAQLLNDLSDKELKGIASYSSSEAFNFGRSAQAAEMKDEIATAQYSAILDYNTCDNCRPLDGQEWEFADERTDKYARGNPDCLGGTRCRCLLVFIHKNEAKAEK